MQIHDLAKRENTVRFYPGGAAQNYWETTGATRIPSGSVRAVKDK